MRTGRWARDVATSTADERERRRLRGPRLALAGLVLTLLGLALLAGLLPTNPTGELRALSMAAAGLLALWVGGILLGRAAWRKGPPTGGSP
jgi:hypothetical protein